MHFISGGQYLLYAFHFLFHQFAHFQLVGRFLGCDGQVDGVQSVDAVIALRLFFGVDDADQLVQPEQSSVRGRHRNGGRVEAEIGLFRDQRQSDPLFSATSVVHVVRAQELFPVRLLDSSLNIVRADSQRTQLFAVVLQPPLHRGGSAYVHLVHARQGGQTGLDVFLGVLLNPDGGRRRIQRERNKRTVGIVFGHPHLDVRIAYPIRQSRPGLPHHGRGFEAYHVDVGMFVQIDINSSPSVSRSRIQVPDSPDACQHGFQLTCHFHLDHPRRSSRHVEADTEARQGTRRIQLDRQQRH